LASKNAAATSASGAATSATNAQLRAWEAEAKKMTAQSYAVEDVGVYVKVWTSNGDGTFTSTNTTDYSAKHWVDKGDEIDDTVVSDDRTFSSSKIQEMHEAQVVAIANLAGASASIYNNTAQVVSEGSFSDLVWTNGQASTNTDIFELGVNEFVFKKAGTYNFFNSLTFMRIGSGAIMDVTFELYDTSDSSVVATFTQPIDIAAGTKETLPFNALVTVADGVNVKVRMSATSAAGTLELYSFNSILTLSSVVSSATVDVMDEALGAVAGSTGKLTDVVVTTDRYFELDLGGL
jgi:hypothetical protein